MTGIRVFQYVKAVDAFVVTPEFKKLSESLGLTEWHPAVWIGRLFIMDNDFGEHWFDNWDEREAREVKAEQLGLDSNELMIVAPDRFQNGRDGPCHPAEIRKLFWTDVLKSLELSYELLFQEARFQNARIKDLLPEEYIEDLEERIEAIKAELAKHD